MGCCRQWRMSKQSHIFGWEEEPVDERPSEFMPSTGYSSPSGYYSTHDLPHPRAKPAASRYGFKTFMLACVALAIVGGSAMVHLSTLLRG